MFRGKRSERTFSESVTYKCWKGKAELEDNIDGSKSIKNLLLNNLKKLNKFAQMLRDNRFRQHRLNSKKIYNRKKLKMNLTRNFTLSDLTKSIPQSKGHQQQP